MKLTKFILALPVLAALFSCSDIDNYDAPNAGIAGTVIDNTTNEGIQTEAGAGFQLCMVEEGYNPVIPIYFYAKADGSFKNTQLFADKYKVFPMNGAFVTPDSVLVNVKKLTEVNFTVTPFMTIHASTPRVISGNIIVDYKLTRPSSVTYDIIKSMTMVSVMPSVNVVVNSKNVSHTLSEKTYADIANTQFSDTIKGLTSDTYYVRVAGLTDNPQSKYNYSKVYTVTIP
ncbi:MAG: DUF3823 domain-containing protein [Bacteroidota bacterium]|nr:DUF3823 domain-containing protein [Bacteroidota bacterium]